MSPLKQRPPHLTSRQKEGVGGIARGWGIAVRRREPADRDRLLLSGGEAGGEGENERSSFRAAEGGGAKNDRVIDRAARDTGLVGGGGRPR